MYEQFIQNGYSGIFKLPLEFRKQELNFEELLCLILNLLIIPVVLLLGVQEELIDRQYLVYVFIFDPVYLKIRSEFSLKF